jgi:PAS domain S-box-containing protein
MSFFSSIDRKEISLLIIEDEQMLRDYMADFLEDIGYKVFKAANGSEGIGLFNRERPDLVLTDLRMPQVNGLEVMAHLKTVTPDTPVIVISGTGAIEDVVQTIKLGAWDFILKPIKELTVLDLAIDRALERKNLIEENRRYRDHLEIEVSKRTNELLQSNKKYEILFNHTGVSVCIADLDGIILEANSRASQFLGYTHEEFCRKKVQDLLTDDEARRLPQYIEFAVKKNQFVFESVFRHRDGHAIPAEINACVLDLDGAPAIFSICRDLSERKSAEKERLRLEKQFSTFQKMESLGLLAGGIAHDFKNIISAISGYLSLFTKILPVGGKEEKYVGNMQLATQKGLLLANKLTQFTRSTSEFAKVDLHKVIAEAVELLRPSCARIRLSAEYGAPEHEIIGDANLLANAFINLGLNARDAITGEGAVTFRTGPARDGAIRNVHCPLDTGGYVQIQVVDNGSGMDQEVMGRLFEPLFTTKEPGKGTGLGLSGVNNCVKLHQGLIDVESAPGKGTTFMLWLPLLPKAGAVEAGRSAPSRVLVIDDEKMACILMQQYLKEIGHEAVLMEHAMESIEYFKHNSSRFNLVLIDYDMTPLNGRELFSELKKINPALKALLVASGTIDSREREGWEEGIVGSITKPFRPDQFGLCVSKALETAI